MCAVFVIVQPAGGQLQLKGTIRFVWWSKRYLSFFCCFPFVNRTRCHQGEQGILTRSIHWHAPREVLQPVENSTEVISCSHWALLTGFYSVLLFFFSSLIWLLTFSRLHSSGFYFPSLLSSCYDLDPVFLASPESTIFTNHLDSALLCSFYPLDTTRLIRASPCCVLLDSTCRAWIHFERNGLLFVILLVANGVFWGENIELKHVWIRNIRFTWDNSVFFFIIFGLWTLKPYLIFLLKPLNGQILRLDTAE